MIAPPAPPPIRSPLLSPRGACSDESGLDCVSLDWLKDFPPEKGAYFEDSLVVRQILEQSRPSFPFGTASSCSGGAGLVDIPPRPSCLGSMMLLV